MRLVEKTKKLFKKQKQKKDTRAHHSTSAPPTRLRIRIKTMKHQNNITKKSGRSKGKKKKKPELSVGSSIPAVTYSSAFGQDGT